MPDCFLYNFVTSNLSFKNQSFANCSVFSRERKSERNERLFFHKIPTLVTDLSVGEAAVARDALCRTLYSRLFTWIVARINDAVKVSTQMSSQPIFCNRNPTTGVQVFLKSQTKL